MIGRMLFLAFPLVVTVSSQLCCQEKFPTYISSKTHVLVQIEMENFFKAVSIDSENFQACRKQLLDNGFDLAKVKSLTLQIVPTEAAGFQPILEVEFDGGTDREVMKDKYREVVGTLEKSKIGEHEIYQSGFELDLALCFPTKNRALFAPVSELQKAFDSEADPNPFADLLKDQPPAKDACILYRATADSKRIIDELAKFTPFPLGFLNDVHQGVLNIDLDQDLPIQGFAELEDERAGKTIAKNLSNLVAATHGVVKTQIQIWKRTSDKYVPKAPEDLQESLKNQYGSIVRMYEQLDRQLEGAKVEQKKNGVVFVVGGRNKTVKTLKALLDLIANTVSL